MTRASSPVSKNSTETREEYDNKGDDVDCYWTIIESYSTVRDIP
jgi:hypothetical protein